MGLILVVGCASQTGSVAPRGPEPVAVVPLPAGPVEGRVSAVNSDHQFVVIDFGGFPIPRIGTVANVFRGDRSVGRVRLTEPSQDRWIVGDVLTGELKRGDLVRP